MSILAIMMQGKRREGLSTLVAKSAALPRERTDTRGGPRCDNLVPNDSTDQKERQHHPCSQVVCTTVKHPDSLDGNEELRPLVYQTPMEHEAWARPEAKAEGGVYNRRRKLI